MLLNVKRRRWLESWNAAIAIAIVGAIRPRATYTPNGTTPSHRSAVRRAPGTRPGRAPEAATSGAAAGSCCLPSASRLASAQFWVTTFSAAACWAWVGNVSAPDGAGGSAA